MASTTSGWWRADSVRWSAHGWTIEVRGDELAEIAYRGRPILRGVRAAVRDRGWRTVPVSALSFATTGNSAALSLLHEGLGARVASRLQVGAVADELEIAWEGVNETDFDACRIGLVVLHNPSDAGRAVTVTHSDGSMQDAAFPVAISPHQPLTDIRALRAGAVTLRFDGDVFEMEDQRNWSDASFKTYGRPLALPYPYRVAAGEIVRQSLRIRVEGSETDAAAQADAAIELRPAGTFPTVGVEVSTAPDPVAASALGAFRVVELNLTTPNWRAALTRAAADGLPLDVRIVTDGDPIALDAAVRALDGLTVLRIAAVDSVLHVSDAATVALLRAAAPSAPVVGGTRSHFTELNREQARIPGDVDGIILTTTPLFHTLDTEQLVEAVGMQRLIAEQAVRIARGRPVHIGPVTLRPRFNNVATTAEPAPTLADLSEGFGAEFTGGVDHRQSAPELAAWVVASAAALAVPGVSSLSWFESAGPRGLEGTPAERAVEALVTLGGGELLAGTSPDGLIWAIGSRRDDADTVLVANLDRTVRSVSVRTGAGTLSASLLPGSWNRLTSRSRS